MTTTDSPPFRVYGDSPLDELRQTISFAIWHATDRELGLQQMSLCGNDSCIPGETVPRFDMDQWKREHDPADKELKKRRHLVALRFASEVGAPLNGWAYNAYVTGGASWAEIGETLGITRQAAWQRFSGPYGQPVS